MEEVEHLVMERPGVPQEAGVVISLIFPKFFALDPIILSNFNDPL